MTKKESQEEENAEEEENTDDDKGGGKGNSNSGSSGQFEQEDLDHVAGKSRKEGHTAGHNSVLKALGFENEEEGIEFLKKAREKEDAEKTELEKLADKVAGLEQDKEDADTALKAEKSSSLTSRLRSAVKLEIVSNSKLSVHPDALDDVWVVLQAEYLGDDGIHISENGKITGVAKSVEKLLKAKPYFASTPDKKVSDNNTRRKKDTVDANGEVIPEDSPKYGGRDKDVLGTRL